MAGFWHDFGVAEFGDGCAGITVDVSGCPEGYVGLEKDVRSATKRIAMLAKGLGGNVYIERKVHCQESGVGFHV